MPHPERVGLDAAACRFLKLDEAQHLLNAGVREIDRLTEHAKGGRGRRLAGADRAEKLRDRAVLKLEGQIVHRCHVAEPLRQRFGADDLPVRGAEPRRRHAARAGVLAHPGTVAAASLQLIVLTLTLALVFASPAAAASIYVTNSSSLPDAEIADALPAFQRALDQDFAPDWREARGSALFVGDAPPGAWEIRIVDSPECLVCSGYHDLDNGVPYAVVSTLDDWQVTFSHELWEILVNPYLDRMAIVRPKTLTRVYALETADPVEGAPFVYVRPSASGKPVQISDFVTPAWFRRDSEGPWDFTGATKRPLQLLEDGYQLWLHNGAWDALYASRGGKVDGRAKARRWNVRRQSALSLGGAGASPQAGIQDPR